MDKKFKIFITIAIMVLGLGIAGSTFFLVQMVDQNKAVAASNGEVAKGKQKLAYLPLGEAITANVYDEYEEQHIARIVLSFEVNEKAKGYKKFKKTFDKQTVKIRDEVIQTVREQTYEMMSKTDSKAKLGDEITNRVNEILETTMITNVYFSDFFVQ